jgi:hypothetical protein
LKDLVERPKIAGALPPCPLPSQHGFLCVKINFYIWRTCDLCRKDKSSCRVLVVKPLRKWPFKKHWGQVDNGNRM